MPNYVTDVVSERLPFRVAVLVSGSGSNLQVLIDKMQAGALAIEVVAVISNNADAYALVRAKNAGIRTFVIDKHDCGKKYKRTEFEQRALALLAPLSPDLVVLAGFMRILTPLFIDAVSALCPMINLHPSLLPHYKGLDTHARVLKAGDRQHGCSVHLVTAELDAGQVLAQAVLNVTAQDEVDGLQQRVYRLEHQLLPMVVALFAQRLWRVGDTGLENTLGLPLPLRLCFDYED